MSRNGNITASWTYIHTGGLPLTDLSLMYSYEEGASTVSRSVGVNLNDLSVTVSGLVAGEEYTFTVTAENSNGSSSTVCEPVNHIIGKYHKKVYRISKNILLRGHNNTLQSTITAVIRTLPYKL